MSSMTWARADLLSIGPIRTKLTGILIIIHAYSVTIMHLQMTALQWRHNECDRVSNHRRLDCLLKRLFRRKLKKTSKFHVTGLCERNPPVTGGSPHKGPVRRKMLTCDDVIMLVYGAISFTGGELPSTFSPLCYSHTPPPFFLASSKHHWHDLQHLSCDTKWNKNPYRWT